MPVAEQGRGQTPPVSTGQPALGARATLLIGPVSTVILPITELGQAEAAAGPARHLPLPTAWGGTAWSGAGRQAQDTDRVPEKAPTPERPKRPPAHKS